MANLIKRIAMATSRKTGMASIAQEFRSSSNLSITGQKTGSNAQKSKQPGSIHELASFVSYTGGGDTQPHDRIVSFAPTGNQIKKTREVVISHEPNPVYDRRGSEVEITGGHANNTGGKTQGLVSVEEARPERSSSLGSITEGNESLKSAEVPKRERDREESDERRR
jgi:hypothetical protein